MNSEELTGYENEPVETYLPLPADLYPTFYDLERQSQLKDCHYYFKMLNQQRCTSIVELGCGTGHIQEYLYKQGLIVYGIDINHDMLRFNTDRRAAPVLAMDMCQLGFLNSFDAVIVPHNTLCLLPNREKIRRCLREIKRVLVKQGVLIAHLFSITPELTKLAGKRLFQFSMHDMGESKKLIKETIRTYLPQSNTIELEERYKVRSFANSSENVNYRQSLSLTAYPASEWLDILHSTGFNIRSLHSGPDGTPFDETKDTTLLVSATSK